MKKLLVLIPIMLIVVGCGGGGQNIYPLTVGNTWNYTTITTTTTPIDTTTDTTTVDVEITAQTALDNGKEVFEVVSGTSTSYIEDADDYVFGYDTKADTIPDTLLALPLEEGKSWTVTSDTAGTAFKTYVVGKENVIVPFGTYNDCWKLGNIIGNDTTGVNVYYAEGTGMVKTYSLIGDTTFSVETTQQLDSVTIK